MQKLKEMLMKRLVLTLLVFGSLFVQVHAAKESPPQAYSKSGFLMGVELGMGLGAGSSKGKSVLRQENSTGAHVFTMFSDIEATSMTQGRWILGYQKYFGKEERLGFDFKTRLGMGLLKFNHNGQYVIFNNTQNFPLEKGESGLRTIYFAGSAGVETNFLYDFYSKKDKAVGLRIGVAYDFVYGVNMLISPIDLSLNDDYFNAYNDKSMKYSVISPKVGLHFYNGKHQFIVVASFDKALGKSVNVNHANEPNVGDVKDTLTIENDFFVTLNLSYVYKY